jgi:hypothetical protein
MTKLLDRPGCIDELATWAVEGTALIYLRVGVFDEARLPD